MSFFTDQPTSGYSFSGACGATDSSQFRAHTRIAQQALENGGDDALAVAKKKRRKDKQRATQAARQEALTDRPNPKGGKGGEKGKRIRPADVDDPATKANNISMPRELVLAGGFPLTNASLGHNNICFDYNTKIGCKKAKDGEACNKGLHVCAFRTGRFACSRPKSLLGCKHFDMA